METIKNEFIDDLKELADEDAGKLLNDFFILAMTYEEIRNNTSNEQATKIYMLIKLLDDLKNTPEND